MNKINAHLCLILCCFFIARLFAAPEVSIDVSYSKEHYTQGDTIILALQCQLPEAFHLYSNPLGPGIGKPLKLQVSTNRGVEWWEARKSPAKKFYPQMGDWVWAYEKSATFFLLGTITHNNDSVIKDTLVFDALICDKACVPFAKEIPLSITLSSESSKGAPFSYDKKIKKQLLTTEVMTFTKGAGIDNISISTEKPLLDLGQLALNPDEIASQWNYTPKESTFQFNILLALVLAFIAGIILNAMPCVLPVLGIKILSFSEGSEGTKKHAVLRSLAFAGGMVSLFLILASFAAFAGLSWGEQFQEPKMLVAIISIIFVFALGMFDVFIILVPNKVAEIEQKRGKGKNYLDDFIKGMFTTILATPCSGPLLGATLAWTLLQSPLVIYMVFGSIGLGMAFPYVLFSSSSRLMKLIPKPGAWMADFKHLMGFLLFGFAIYLMMGLPKDMVLPTIILCTVLAFSVMLYGRFAPFGSTIQKRLITGLIMLCIAGVGIHASFNILYPLLSAEHGSGDKKSAALWQEFSVDKLQQAHEAKRSVVIDFTANWCMNCQFNKVTAYHTREVSALLKKKNIVALKADLTKENTIAESLLHHLGSRSVPFFAIFPGNDHRNPIILRDIVRKKRLVNILSQIE